MKIFGFEYYQQESASEMRYGKHWAWKPAKLDLINNPKKLLKFSPMVEIYLEKKFSRGYTLIISRKNVQIGALIQELRRAKKPFVYIHWDEYVKEGTICFDSAKKKNSLNYKKHHFDLSKAKSVYFDYSDIGEVFYFKRSKFSNKEKIFLARWQEAVGVLESVTPNARWFPAKPSEMRYESQNKFGELLIAKKMGIQIPKMIYTNDPREAQRFLFEQESVMKESGLKFFEDNKNRLFVFKNKKISPMHKELSYLDSTPCMFQEFIDKKFDVRVAVICGKVLACKIESQAHGKAKVDWRGNEHLVKFTPFKLPRAIEQKLSGFQQKMNFQFSSFDLVVDQKNNYYFLEMNRPGQWFFIEALSGIPIAKTLAAAIS